MAKTTILDVPDHNGTPGLPNSRRVANLGPTFDRLQHDPAIPDPGQPVTVSVEATDPQGIREMNLWYRIDEGPWASTPMVAGPDNLYAAVIPRNDAGEIVQFYVQGTDRDGAVSVFPAAGPESRALWIVNDGRGKVGPLHNLHLIMTDTDAGQLHSADNVLSNQRIGATVVYDGQVFYDVAVRLKGSFVGRDAPRVGFNISFHPDQLFRGVHAKVAVDRSAHTDIGVDEILVKHAASAAGGIPSMYDDLIHFVSPKRQHTGTAALRMAGYDDVYLDSQFDHGTDGTLFEYEVIRWATTTVDGDPESVKRARAAWTTPTDM